MSPDDDFVMMPRWPSLGMLDETWGICERGEPKPELIEKAMEKYQKLLKSAEPRMTAIMEKAAAGP
jgi:hypothetical protein